MKKILATTVLSISVLTAMNAQASAPGIYITGQLGYSNNRMDIKADNVIPLNDVSNNNLAGRVAIGYQFNQNFAIEAGYLRTSQKNTTLVYLNRRESTTVDTGGKITYNQNAVDLVAKGILPINNNLNLYGKLGVAYLTTQGNLTLNPAEHDPQPFSYDLENIAKRKLAPEVAIGISYDFTPNVSIDTSWTHIHPLGNNRPGNVNFFSVGLGYNFG
jgi:OmpA-OmpF porin, OOP family